MSEVIERTNQAVSVNVIKELFVIKQADGCSSCLSFFVVSDRISSLCSMILANKACSASIEQEISELSQVAEGSLKQYAAYERILEIASKFKLGTYYSKSTPSQVKAVLDKAMASGETLRIFYGEDGEDWLEENDTIGTIGRSTGTIKIPLLVAKGERGGTGILDNCIVRIVNVDSGVEVYRHNNYRLKGKLGISEVSDKDKHGVSHEVTADKTVLARFESFEMAASYVSFLSGNTHTKPWEH